MRNRGGMRIAARVAACLVVLPLAAMAQPAPDDVTVTAIVSAGLSTPIGVTHAPGDDARLFVNQQGGALRVVRDGALLGTPMLTLNSSTTCKATPSASATTVGFTSTGERGLLGVAFHPSFQTNGQLFLSFTDVNGDTMVTRYTMADPSADVLSANDRATCLVILRIDQDGANHNGGNILFGPDGLLYVGMGDGGGGGAGPGNSGSNDACNRAQTLDPADLANADDTANCGVDDEFTDSGGNADSRALLGKMLRIDVNHSTSAGANGLCASAADGSANYAIPQTNPFAGDDVQDACDETWAYGLRNPWRWSFDRATGDLFIGDVGQNAWEEVSLLAAVAPNGANLAWKVCEGTHLRGSCTMACSAGGSITPIIEYRNANANCNTSATPTGNSVTGGFRYRGPDPILQGVYFYGDANRSEVRWSVDSGGNNWVQPSAAVIKGGLAGSALGFGEDEVGALYMVVGSGTLYRIGAAGSPNKIFSSGYEDGEP